MGKDVKVRVTFESDAKAALRDMDDIATRAEKVERSTSKAQQALRKVGSQGGKSGGGRTSAAQEDLLKRAAEEEAAEKRREREADRRWREQDRREKQKSAQEERRAMEIEREERRRSGEAVRKHQQEQVAEEKKKKADEDKGAKKAVNEAKAKKAEEDAIIEAYERDQASKRYSRRKTEEAKATQEQDKTTKTAASEAKRKKAEEDAIIEAYEQDQARKRYSRRKVEEAKAGKEAEAKLAAEAEHKAAGGHFGKAASAIGQKFGVDLGALASLGPYAAIAAAVAQGVHTGMRAIRLGQDEHLTGDQRTRGIMATLPFGETIQSYSDTLTGRSRGLERIDEQAVIRRAESQGQIDLRRRQHGFDVDITSGAIQRDVLRGATAAEIPNIDRSTAKGEIEYQLAVKRTAAENQIAAAERAGTVATKEREAAQKRLTKLTGEEAAKKADLNRWDERSERLEARAKSQEIPGWAWAVPGAAPTLAGWGVWGRDAYNSARYGQTTDEARKNIISKGRTAKEEFEGAAALKMQGAEELASRQRAEAEAKHALRKANLSKAQIEVEEAGRQADVFASGDYRIGGSREKRLMGLQALKYVNRAGFENVPADIAALAEEAAPNRVRKMREAAGRNSAEHAEYVREAPEDYGDTKGAQQRQRKGINELVKAELESDKAMAAELAEIPKALARGILDTVKEVVAAAVRQLKKDLLETKIASGSR